MKNVDFSFIVINRNNERHIERCIASLRALSIDKKEIIVVDDFSTDRSIELITSKADKIIELSKNDGIANARKEGLLVSKGEYVTFIDSDIELLSFDANRIVKIFAHNKKVVGIVGRYDSPKSKRYNWNWVLDARRSGIQLKGDHAFTFSQKRFTTLSGGFCIYKKQRLTKLSGEGEIGVASEDLLQQIELLHKNHEFYYMPDLRGIHHHFRTFHSLALKAKSEAKGEIWLIQRILEKRIGLPIFDPVLTFPGLIILAIIFSNPYVLVFNYFPNILLLALQPSIHSVFLLIYQIFKDILKIISVFRKIVAGKLPLSRFISIILIGTLYSIIGKINWLVRYVSKERYGL